MPSYDSLARSASSPVDADVSSVTSRPVSCGVFLFGLLSLVVPSGYSIGPALLVLLSGYGLLREPRTLLHGPGKEDVTVIGVMAGLAALLLVNILLQGDAWQTAGVPIRLLLAVPVLLLVLSCPPSLGAMWGGLILGSVLTGSWAMWQKLVWGVHRAGGFTNTINFGDICMLMGLICLAGLGWAMSLAGARRRYWILALLVGGAFGIIGSLMSGTRGGWIGFPFAAWVLYRSYGEVISRRVLRMGVFMCAGVIALMVITPATGIQQRVEAGVSDVTKYVEDRNAGTSAGARLEMWRGAFMMIAEQPWLGRGETGYAEARDAMIERGELSRHVKPYEHPHNEFLDAWVKRGILGLLALLALYLVPLRLFYRRLDSNDLTLRSLAVAGVLLPLTFLDFGMTWVMFSQASGVMVFAFWLAIVWGTLRAHERRLETLQAP
ncbi:O-antigen ligase family protein [Cobetia marina]